MTYAKTLSDLTPEQQAAIVKLLRSTAFHDAMGGDATSDLDDIEEGYLWGAIERLYNTPESHGQHIAELIETDGVSMRITFEGNEEEDT